MPFELPPRRRFVVVDVDASAASDGAGADDVLQPTESQPAFPFEVPAGSRATDDGAKPGSVVRAVARVPAQDAVDERRVERDRGVVRRTDVVVSSRARVARPEPDSPVAARAAVPVRVRGRASVGTPVLRPQTGPTRDPSAVVSGRAAVQAVNEMRAEHRSAVAVPDVTMVMAETLETLVGVAARQVPGVALARANVGRALGAPTGGGDHHDSVDVLVHPDGRAARILIDLRVGDGYPAATVIQNVRSVVVCALRSLLDVDVASVNIVVHEVVPDHNRLLPVMHRSAG